MTSKIIVNNIEADTGISTITFNNDISSNTVRGNIISDGTSTFDVISGVSTIGVTTAHVTSINNLSYPTAGALSNRSLIINGAMQVAQRGTVVNAGNEYGGPDRTRFSKNDGAFTISQDTDAPSGSGFANSYKVDVTSVAGTSGSYYVFLKYRIEGQDLQGLKKGTSSAESLTLQFWIKSPKTGTYIAELYDVDNNRTISKSYTINSANTWEHKILTFPGDTTGGALDNDNDRSLEINLWLFAGTNYSSGTLQTAWAAEVGVNRAVGQVNAADNTANNIYMTGLQLEVGENATEFQHCSYGEQLALCQRYYYKDDSTIEGGGLAVVTGALDSIMGIQADFPVTMRATPSLNLFGTTYRTGGTADAQRVTKTRFVWGRKQTGSGTANVGAYATGGFEVNAEL